MMTSSAFGLAPAPPSDPAAPPIHAGAGSVGGARERGIDACRYVLLLGVIMLHATANIAAAQRDAAYAIACTLCHAAVPVYFIAAGYFLRWQAKRWQSCLIDPIVRLLPIYVFWTLAYYLYVCLLAHRLIVYGPREWLTGGIAFHLWFLPALMTALMVVAFGSRVLGRHAVVTICIVLAGIGLSRGAYHDVLALGGESHRGGMYVAPLFVLIGTWLATMRWRPRWPAVLALLLAAFALQIGEHVVLNPGHDLNLTPSDFTLATFPFGVAVFLVGRAIPAGAIPTAIVNASGVTLGAYAIHLAILWQFSVALAPGSLAIAFVCSVTVLCLATVAATAIAALPPLRRLVS